MSGQERLPGPGLGGGVVMVEAGLEAAGGELPAAAAVPASSTSGQPYTYQGILIHYTHTLMQYTHTVHSYTHAVTLTMDTQTLSSGMSQSHLIIHSHIHTVTLIHLGSHTLTLDSCSDPLLDC